MDSAFRWSAWGLVSGAMLVVANLGTVGFAIPALGIAVTTAISSGSYGITAYIWSAYILDQGMRSVALSLVGTLIVVCGVCGVAAATRARDSAADDRPAPHQEEVVLLGIESKEQSAPPEVKTSAGDAATVARGAQAQGA